MRQYVRWRLRRLGRTGTTGGANRSPRGRRARGAVLAADLEGQQRSFGVGEVDLHAVLNVDGAHLPAIDVHPVEAAVVDGNPAPMVEPQNQMLTRDQSVPNPYVGSGVAPDETSVPGANVRVDPS
jgi:hypothetical protein